MSDEDTKHERVVENGKSHGAQTSFSLTTSEAERNEAKGEKNSEQEQPQKDLIKNTPPISPLTVGKDNDWNNASENKGTSLIAYRP